MAATHAGRDEVANARELTEPCNSMSAHDLGLDAVADAGHLDAGLSHVLHVQFMPTLLSSDMVSKLH